MDLSPHALGLDWGNIPDLGGLSGCRGTLDLGANLWPQLANWEMVPGRGTTEHSHSGPCYINSKACVPALFLREKASRQRSITDIQVSLLGEFLVLN